jgi:hypothetical protein
MKSSAYARSQQSENLAKIAGGYVGGYILQISAGANFPTRSDWEERLKRRNAVGTIDGRR